MSDRHGVLLAIGAALLLFGLSARADDAAGPAPFSVELAVAAGKPTHTISEHIYGMASGKEEDLKAWGIASTRWGGNAVTRFNWKLGYTNAGSDWFFANRGKPPAPGEDTPWVAAVKAQHSAGRDFFLTVPTIGWVSKDKDSFGFSIKKYGPQRKVEQWHADMGDGVKADGKNIKGNDPHDTSVEASPEFIAEGIKAVAAAKGKGQTVIYALDNEPMLWHATHRDVHPKPCTYDELWQRSVEYGEAIKQADRAAVVAGPASWGWLDLFSSAADQGADNYQTKADSAAHGGGPLVVWYLRKMADYEKSHGRRLLDVLDVHFYPQGAGVFSPGGDEKVSALRLRSTRALWDHDYHDESWIAHTTSEPIELLPRLKKWIDENYPSTRLCLGEWNWGGSDNVSGALAAAEALGVFGVQKLDMAYLWTTPEGTQRRAWDLYRNYDSRGARFGDRSLAAKSSDHARVAIFAARSSAHETITVALINKDLKQPADAELQLAGFKIKTVNEYQWSGKSLKARFQKVERQPPQLRDRVKLPPASLTMLEIKIGASN